MFCFFDLNVQGCKKKNKKKRMSERQFALKQLFSICSQIYKLPIVNVLRYDVSDRGNQTHPVYSMCYDKRLPYRKQFCGIDWVFYHWPSANISNYWQTVNEIMDASQKPPMYEKVGWYGNIASPLPDVIEYHTRPLLKRIGDQNPHLMDIIDVRPQNRIINQSVKNYITLPELVERYKYLLDIGGNGYSGRLKFLLYSGRPVLIVDRNYIEFFHDDLKEFVHYVPVKMDLSDLIEKILWLEEHPTEAQQIATNAREFALSHFTQKNLMDRILYVYNVIHARRS